MLTIEEQIERLVDAAMDQLDRDPAEASSTTGPPQSLGSVRWARVAGADLNAAWEPGDTGNLDSLRTTKLTLLDVEPTLTRLPSGRRWPIVIAAAVVLMLVGALVLVARDDASDPQVPAASPAVPTAASGLIALAGRSGESGYAEIYVVASDGTGLRTLTSTPGVSEMAPAWSPDGTRLAFLRNVHLGGGELVVIDPATGVETFSADIPNRHNTDVLPPQWSPDGRLIVINLANWPGFMMVDLETGTWTTITGGFVRGWSPDGKWFVFHSFSDGPPASLLLVPADLLGTTDLDDVPNLPGVRLLVESGGGGGVTWAPDSSAAAISSADSIEVGPIEVVTIVDGERRTLTEDGAAPTWSPDGSHVAYVRCTSRTGGSVWVSAADGTGARAVATSLVAPTWSPGSLLTLVNADGVFTVRPDGTGMTQLAQVTRSFGGLGPFGGAGPCEGDNQFFRPVWQPGATEAANTDATETKTTEAPVTTEATVTVPPSVTVTPTAPPRPLPRNGEQLVPGTYFVDEVWGTPTPRIFFTIGDGWTVFSSPNSGVSGIWSDLGYVDFSHPVAVYSDACHWETGYHPLPVDTVDGLVAALSEQQGWAEVTAPSDISVDGYEGKAFQRTAPADMSDCSTRRYQTRTSDDVGTYPDVRSWENHDGVGGGSLYEPGQIETLSVLDIDDTVIVISTGLWPGPTPADHADFAADVLDSIRIERT